MSSEIGLVRWHGVSNIALTIGEDKLDSAALVT
jgi:hypothetical protein